MRSILGMDIRRLFGANLRRCRLAAGLSQEVVAERMDVDRAHVSSMERGRQNVTLGTLWLACEALNVRPADLFDETPRPPAAAPGAAARRVVSRGRRRRTP